MNTITITGHVRAQISLSKRTNNHWHRINVLSNYGQKYNHIHEHNFWAYALSITNALLLIITASQIVYNHKHFGDLTPN